MNSKENTWFWDSKFNNFTKNILASLGITASGSAVDAWIKALIISNEEMNNIMKIFQALEDFNILLKGVTKTIRNETKEQKGGFLGMLLCKLFDI